MDNRGRGKQTQMMAVRTRGATVVPTGAWGSSFFGRPPLGIAGGDGGRCRNRSGTRAAVLGEFKHVHGAPQCASFRELLFSFKKKKTLRGLIGIYRKVA